MKRIAVGTPYAKVVALWAAIVLVLFTGYEIVERTALRDASVETLRVLHVIRGAGTALVVAIGVAALLLRSAHPLQEVVRAAGRHPARGDDLAVQGDARSGLFGWLVRLRWLAIGGVALVLFVATSVLDRLPPGTSGWLWSIAAALAGYNAFLALAGPARAWRPGRFDAQLVVDCLALAALVHFAGGIENPFVPFFVLHVANAGIVLSRRGAAGVLGLVLALVASVALGEGTGILTHHCIERAPGRCTAGALDFLTVAAALGLGLTLVATSSFTRALSARLREDQASLVRAVEDLQRDKEELAAARAATERERQKLQAVVDCMGDAVVFSNPDGRVLLRNRRAVELWQSLCSGEGGIEDCHGPDRWPALAELFRGVERADSPRFHRTFERRGSTFEATYAPVRTEDGVALGLIMVARDVTERRALDRRLMHEERTSVVGKLAAAVAHEINNPIGVVALYGQHVLARLPKGHALREHLETILRNAEACRKIVGDLLHLARPRDSTCLAVDPRTLCHEVLHSLAPLAQGAGVELRTALDGAPLSVEADPDALRQAVLNIALNAIEASPRGGSLEVGVSAAGGHGAPAAAIEVRDHGAGIAIEDRERIFEPFYTTKASGTGLGLAVAKSIIEGHGGRIEVESEVGRGSTFRVLLPGSDERARVVGTLGGREARSPAQGGDMEAPPHARPRKRTSGA